MSFTLEYYLCDTVVSALGDIMKRIKDVLFSVM